LRSPIAIQSNLELLYYDAGLSAFISRDPAGYSGGKCLNLYEYSWNTPINRSDPSGLQPWMPPGGGGIVPPGQPFLPGTAGRNPPPPVPTPDDACKCISNNPNCPKGCDEASCQALLKQIRDIASSVKTPGITWDRCADWCGDFLGKLGTLEKNPCVKKGASSLVRFTWFWWPGKHYAYKVELCNGKQWYMDLGTPLINVGGGDHVGTPEDIPICCYGEERL